MGNSSKKHTKGVETSTEVISKGRHTSLRRSVAPEATTNNNFPGDKKNALAKSGDATLVHEFRQDRHESIKRNHGQNSSKEIQERKQFHGSQHERQNELPAETMPGTVYREAEILDGFPRGNSTIDPATEALQRQIQDLKSEIEKKNEEIKRLEEENNALRYPDSKRNLYWDPSNPESQREALLVQVNKLRFERDQMAEVNKDLSGRLEQANKELDDLQTRLSRLASSKLTDNNPNISDLSDPNRPNKIAERYQELYCNEWSEAYDVLINAKTERQAVDILLNMTKEIYRVCFDISEKQFDDLKSQISVFTGSEFSTEFSHVLVPFKEKRKKRFRSFIPAIRQEISKHRDRGEFGFVEHSVELDKFVGLTTELCWLMCIQDPKVHLHTECDENEKFDSEVFASYTVGGSFVDFLVWPALYLYVGGPLLKKGVAQGKGGKPFAAENAAGHRNRKRSMDMSLKSV